MRCYELKEPEWHSEAVYSVYNTVHFAHNCKLFGLKLILQFCTQIMSSSEKEIEYTSATCQLPVDLVSCQGLSDLRTSNILFANQSKSIDVNQND